MAARIVNISIHAEDPAALARFWGLYEGYAIMMRDPEGNEFCLQ